MPSIPNQNEVKVVVVLVPSHILVQEHPLLFWRLGPHSQTTPIETVQVVENASCIDNDIILTVVDEHSQSTLQNLNNTDFLRIQANLQMTWKCLDRMPNT